MKSPVCEMFGIEFPILAFSHCRDVVAAVSKAGGMGVLGAVAHTPERLEIDLGWIEDEVGDKPYGLDLIVPAKLAGDGADLTVAKIEQLLPPGHVEFLDDLLERYGVPPLPSAEPEPGDGASSQTDGGWARGQASAPFSSDRASVNLDLALEHPVALIANALGPPPSYMIERAHEKGVPVAALAGKPVHAERHVAAGVDLIVAQGSEAGGHTGDIGTMVLVPEIVDAVAPIPVLGAGGIGRGRQMAAAMALGAAGVWCGSVWLTTEEAETHPTVKRKFLAAGSDATLRSPSLTGKPARQLRSAWTDEWARDDTPDPLGMPLQSVLVAEAQRRIDRAAHTEGSGAAELSNYFVGQVVGSMNKVKTTRQVVYEMIEEFIEAAESLGSMLEEQAVENGLGA